MSLNHRQYFRCPLPTDPSAAEGAVLVVGRRKIQGRLIEMSLTGFGVLVPESLPACKEPLARLKVRGLDYIVRVTRQDLRRDGVLVALQQVEELLPNSTLIPATPLGLWLTRAAWAAAVCIVLAAICCLTDVNAVVPLSLHP